MMIFLQNVISWVNINNFVWMGCCNCLVLMFFTYAREQQMKSSMDWKRPLSFYNMNTLI